MCYVSQTLSKELPSDELRHLTSKVEFDYIGQTKTLLKRKSDIKSVSLLYSGVAPQLYYNLPSTDNEQTTEEVIDSFMLLQ